MGGDPIFCGPAPPDMNKKSKNARLWFRIGFAYVFVYAWIVLAMTGLLAVFAWVAVQETLAGGSWLWAVLAAVIVFLLVSAWVAIIRAILASRRKA